MPLTGETNIHGAATRQSKTAGRLLDASKDARGVGAFKWQRHPALRPDLTSAQSMDHDVQSFASTVSVTPNADTLLSAYQNSWLDSYSDNRCS